MDTGVFLGASGQTFGRPIHGQMEIVGVSMPDISTRWTDRFQLKCEFFYYVTFETISDGRPLKASLSTHQTLTQ